VDVEVGGGAVVVSIALAPGGKDQLAFGVGYGVLEGSRGFGRRAGIEYGFRQVLRLNPVRFTENHGALDGVFEFADVAGPGMIQQAAFGFGRDSLDRAAATYGGAIEEVLG
jgi:hypothetical protein